VTSPIAAVMIFVDQPEHVANWWAEHMGRGTIPRAQNGFWCYQHDGVEVGFHPSDPLANPPGASVVVYWTVVDLRLARERLLNCGCTPHRGPLPIGSARQICQLVDPFGNVFGLDGP
jgi:predicted enzyme related to lactoylglutathione lyase